MYVHSMSSNLWCGEKEKMYCTSRHPLMALVAVEGTDAKWCHLGLLPPSDCVLLALPQAERDSVCSTKSRVVSKLHTCNCLPSSPPTSMQWPHCSKIPWLYHDMMAVSTRADVGPPDRWPVFRSVHMCQCACNEVDSRLQFWNPESGKPHACSNVQKTCRATALDRS
jgi:hypothetical protein